MKIIDIPGPCELHHKDDFLQVKIDGKFWVIANDPDNPGYFRLQEPEVSPTAAIRAH